MKSQLEHDVEDDVERVETAIDQDGDGAFQNWIVYQRDEHRSILYGNIVAGVIVVAMLAACVLLLARIG